MRKGATRVKADNGEIIVTPTVGKWPRVQLWTTEYRPALDADERTEVVLKLRQARALAFDLLKAADVAEGRKTPGPKPKPRKR